VNCESTSPAYQPSDFELRTLGAILFQSIRDAWQSGQDRVWFRGYCIEARRIDVADMADMADGGHSLLMLTLRIAGVAGMRDRRFIAVAPYPIPGAGFDIELIRVRAVAQRRLKSHVGCVSPIDARNASPETGQIS
jgi:hypothetical protein